MKLPSSLKPKLATRSLDGQLDPWCRDRGLKFAGIVTSILAASAAAYHPLMQIAAESDAVAARKKADDHAINLRRNEEEERHKEAIAAIERAKDAEEAKRLAEAEKQRQREQKDIWKQEILVIGQEYAVRDDTLSEISEGEPKVFRVRFEPVESGTKFHVDDTTSDLAAKDWLPLKGDIFPSVFVSEVKKERRKKLGSDGEEEVIVVSGAGHLGLKPGKSFWTKETLLQACRDLKNGKPVEYNIKRDNPEANDMVGLITPVQP